MPKSTQEKQPTMSLTLLKRSTLPVSTRGAAGTDAVAISEGGQFRLSTPLAKKIGDAKKFATGWADKTKRLYAIMVSEATIAKLIPKGEKPEDYMGTLSRGKDGDQPPYFAGAGILKNDIPDYNFANSGNQSFPATYDEKTGTITFVVPAGVLPKRESSGAGRPKGSKNKPNGKGDEGNKPVGVASTPEAGSGVPMTNRGDEINLEEAE